MKLAGWTLPSAIDGRPGSRGVRGEKSSAGRWHGSAGGFSLNESRAFWAKAAQQASARQLPAPSPAQTRRNQVILAPREDPSAFFHGRRFVVQRRNEFVCRNLFSFLALHGFVATDTRTHP